MKKIIIFMILFCCNAKAEEIANFYLNNDWVEVDQVFLKSNFNAYLSDKKYMSVEVYENKTTEMYALVTGGLFLNFEHKNVCSSEIELRLFSKKIEDLNINSFLIGKRFFIKKEGASCKGDPKENSTFSIGYISGQEFYDIFGDFNKTKNKIESIDKSCNINRILHIEKDRDGSLNAFSMNKNDDRFSIIFRKEKSKTIPEECFQILD